MSRISRRSLLALLPLASAARALARPVPGDSPPPQKTPATRSKAPPRPSVVVVGAGAFGGWTALHLRRRGARVTLVDAWGPGNSRASSGGATRVIRGVYGPNRIYTAMARRAFQLWHENEARWKKTLYTRTGALWMVADSGDFVRASIPFLKEFAFAYEELTPAEAGRRYPQVDFDGIQWALLEKEAGYLLARRSCADVLEGFLAEGGTYREGVASPGKLEGGRAAAVALSDGTKLTADAYVFACGPWLPKLFPDVVGSRIQPTRQEVFYFGTPAGDPRFSERQMPVWVETPRFFYGIPGNERRGFKIADDARGPAFDPTAGDRTPTADGAKGARAYISRRFPALADAPLLEARVCQYENSPDSHFIVDRHPEAENLWLVGGGSGHGFKHGPALGELVAANVLGRSRSSRRSLCLVSSRPSTEGTEVAMQNLFDSPARQEILERLGALSPGASRQWGKMDAGQMLAHCSVALEAGTGDKPRKQQLIGRLLSPFVRKGLLGEKPFSRNSPTDPTFIVADAREFAAERERLLRLVHRFCDRGPAEAGKHAHSFFGRMSGDEWGRLMYKHIDHHLKQFGS